MIDHKMNEQAISTERHREQDEINKIDKKPCLMDSNQVLDKQGVTLEEGLDYSEVKARRRKFGPNCLRTRSRKSAWKILLDQFNSIVVWLLIISAGVSFAFGKWIDGSAVIAVILINALIGFVIELRAVRSMEALAQMSRVVTRVRRQGKIREIPAEQLVPGDIVQVDGGDVIAADLRLIEASKLQANESNLTGESEPVEKNTITLHKEIPLAERSNMLFKGTSVTRGAGYGVVINTGMQTELGKITSLVAEAGEHTPLEKRLDKLGEVLVWVTLGIIVVVALAGILRGKDIFLMIETAIALAVAAVLEGLPIVATIALARGMWRMAEHNALINRLSAVETLGSTNIICTDKTGTLTENQMTVTKIVLGEREIDVSGEGLQREGRFYNNGRELNPSQSPELKQFLEVGILCNNAVVQKGTNGDLEAIGEPLEIALLVAGLKAGLRREKLLEKFTEEREEAFDPEVKMMATYHVTNRGYWVTVKGAPEVVLEACSHIRVDGRDRIEMSDEYKYAIIDKNKKLAGQGLRMLALAAKHVNSPNVQPYEELTFFGLAAMQDPPREEVSEALQACKRAGIRVAMVTGDQPVTARNIAQAVDLVGDDPDVIMGQDLKEPEDLRNRERQRLLSAPIYARVSPKQKLDLIAMEQNARAVVAMTGDGVNDAPALKKADIGIAMGKRGTQVAREAADMVLEDDAFSTIVLSIQLGRVIFNNIRRFILFLISCNVSEILVVFLASIANLPLPIRPLQILFLNLVTDVFPALALGVSKDDSTVMEHEPRDPKEPILTRTHWMQISGYSLVITLVVLGAFGLASAWLDMPTQQVMTISFLTLAFCQLWHVFNMCDRGSDLLRNDVVNNPYIWGALGLCVLLLLAAVYIPPLADVLKIVDPGLEGWGLILVMSLIPLLLGQISMQIDLSG